MPSVSIFLLLDAFLPGNQLVASLWIKLLGDKGFLTSTKTANTFLLKDASNFLELGLPLLENAQSSCIALAGLVCALLAASAAP